MAKHSGADVIAIARARVKRPDPERLAPVDDGHRDCERDGCAVRFKPVRHQRFCSKRCRKLAFLDRQASGTSDAQLSRELGAVRAVGEAFRKTFGGE